MAEHRPFIAAGVHWSGFWRPVALMVGAWFASMIVMAVDPSGRLTPLLVWPILAILGGRALWILAGLTFRILGDRVVVRPGWVDIERPGRMTSLPAGQITATHVKKNPVEMIAGGGTLVIESGNTRVSIRHQDRPDDVQMMIERAVDRLSRAPTAPGARPAPRPAAAQRTQAKK